MLKRDIAIKIKGTDLDTSADANKIKPINVSDELMTMFSPAGTVSPVLSVGQVVEENLAAGAITPSKNRFNSDMNLIILDSGELSFNVTTKVLSNAGRIDLFAHGKLVTIPAGSIDLSVGFPTGFVVFYVNFDFTTLATINFDQIKVATHSNALIASDKKLIVLGAFYSNKFISAANNSDKTISQSLLPTDGVFSLSDTLITYGQMYFTINDMKTRSTYTVNPKANGNKTIAITSAWTFIYIDLTDLSELKAIAYNLFVPSNKKIIIGQIFNSKLYSHLLSEFIKVPVDLSVKTQTITTNPISGIFSNDGTTITYGEFYLTKTDGVAKTNYVINPRANGNKTLTLNDTWTYIYVDTADLSEIKVAAYNVYTPSDTKIVLGQWYKKNFVTPYLDFLTKKEVTGSSATNLATNPSELLGGIQYDKPLYKGGIIGDSIFNHTAPFTFPTATPNTYLNEGKLGSKSEPVGQIPPMAHTNNAYRILYEKFRDLSESPTSVAFKEHSLATKTGTWSSVIDVTTVAISTESGASISFTIPAGVENVMILYTRQIGGGKADVKVDGVNPSTIVGLTNNNKVRDWSKVGYGITPTDKLDLGYINPNDAIWCNGQKARLCTEVYSGLNKAVTHTISLTKEADTLPVEIWGIAYWNGTFVYPVNKSYNGHEISMLKAYAYQDIYLQEIDFVMGKGHSLNDYSRGDGLAALPANLKVYADKILSYGKRIAFMSGIPFGKSYDTDAEWTTQSGVNYQTSTTLINGVPKDTEKAVVASVKNFCNQEGIPYIPTYEAFLNKVLTSSNKDITTGETMGQIYQHDGQHLREKGCIVLADTVFGTINRPLKELKG